MNAVQRSVSSSLRYPTRDVRPNRVRRQQRLKAETRKPPVGVAIKGFLHRQRDDLTRDAILGLILAVLAFVLAVNWEGEVANRQEMLENTRFVRQVSTENKQQKPFMGMYLKGASLAGLDLSCEVSSLEESRVIRSEQEKNKRRREAGCADFSDSKLRGAGFANADLVGAVLRQTDFRGAKLSGAELRQVNAYDVDFRGANLVEADLRNAKLSEVTFVGGNLFDAQFSGATIKNGDFSSPVPGVRQNVEIKAGGAEFYVVNFRGADLRRSQDLESATLWSVCYDNFTLWPEAFKPPPPDCLLWDLNN